MAPQPIMVWHFSLILLPPLKDGDGGRLVLDAKHVEPGRTNGEQYDRLAQLFQLVALVERLEEHSILDSRSDIADQIASD